MLTYAYHSNCLLCVIPTPLAIFDLQRFKRFYQIKNYPHPMKDLHYERFIGVQTYFLWVCHMWWYMWWYFAFPVCQLSSKELPMFIIMWFSPSISVWRQTSLKYFFFFFFNWKISFHDQMLKPYLKAACSYANF